MEESYVRLWLIVFKQSVMLQKCLQAQCKRPQMPLFLVVVLILSTYGYCNYNNLKMKKKPYIYTYITLQVDFTVLIHECMYHIGG